MILWTKKILYTAFFGSETTPNYDDVRLRHHRLLAAWLIWVLASLHETSELANNLVGLTGGMG